jgi:membrane-associated phospholipid phosphatase
MTRHFEIHFGSAAALLVAMTVAGNARAQTAASDPKTTGNTPAPAISAPTTTPAPATSASASAATATPPPAPAQNQITTPQQPPFDPNNIATDDNPLPGNSPARRKTLVPHPLEEEPVGGIKFTADPIGDGAILSMALGFSAISELILSTGEIRPQQIDSTFQSSSLLGIDRGAISQKIDPNASAYSTVALVSAVGFAVLHPVISGVSRGSEAFLVDATIYAETTSIAWGLDDLAKIAVRRPRPVAYIDRNNYIAAGGDPAKYDNTSTDSALSFYSGHVTEVAAISATATYLTFARYKARDVRPWITVLAGSALTLFTAVERVRAGAHFPTDTIAGAMAGAGVGILVPHLHREDSVRQRPVWVGFAPSVETKGGTVTFGGQF